MLFPSHLWLFRQGDLMAALLVGMLLFWETQAAAQVASSTQGQPVPFQVCERSFFWTRPPEEIQAKKWTFPRYGKTVEEGRKSYEWNHNFFLYTGSASLEQDVLDLTGMWTVDDVARLCGLEEHAQIVNFQQASVWMLLQEIEGIKRHGTVYTLTVKPMEKGFQRVDFPRPPGPRKNLTLIFLSSEGQEIDRVIEGVTHGAGDIELEWISGRVVAIRGAKVTVDTGGELKVLVVSSKTSVWKGGPVTVEAIQPDDRVSAGGLPVPDGTIAAMRIEVNRVSLLGIVESVGRGKVLLALAGPGRKKTNKLIDVELTPQTTINDSKGRPEDIRVGAYMQVEGAERQNGTVLATRISTFGWWTFVPP